jgi:MFS family permease
VLVGALMLTTLTRTTPSVFLLLAYLIFGIGSGAVNPPITNTAISGMPASQAGVAGAVASTSRQVGVTLGVAVVGAVVGGATAGSLGPGFATATHAGWWILAALGVIVLALGYLTTTSWAARRRGRPRGGCSRSRFRRGNPTEENVGATTGEANIFEAAGCIRCGWTGYHGRMAVYEVMPVTEKLRSMILNRQGHDDVVATATARGTRTLAQDGVEKVRQGLTSLVEVSRVTASL